MWRFLKIIVACLCFGSHFEEGSLGQGNSSRSLKKRDTHCDIVIRENEGWILSPNYPRRYSRYERCLYSVERYSNDVCQVKLIFTSFDLEESVHCYTDYVELQDGNKPPTRLCGLLPAGTQKILNFRENSGLLVFEFKSNGDIGGEGFSIKVKQVRHSCKDTTERKDLHSSLCAYYVNGYSGRITSPGYPYNYKPGEECTYTIRRAEPRACQVELDFRRFELEVSPGCFKDYLEFSDGTKHCGSMGYPKRTIEFPSGKNEMTFIFHSDNHGGTGRGFDILLNQKPGPCNNDAFPSSGRQCDVMLSKATGIFMSPGFPRSFGPNHHCTYSVIRPDPSVCQLELDFLFFDMGHDNPGNCASGPYFELPGHVRFCHVFTGKKIVQVPPFKDPVEFHFVSNQYSSGKGFKIHVTQLPNTCKGLNPGPPRFPEAKPICYQEVNSYFGYFDPPKNSWKHGGVEICEYAIRKADSEVCVVRLQMSSRYKYPSVSCLTNHVELPDGTRMCLALSYPRELRFRKGTNTLFLKYRGRDPADFHLIVEQRRNSCGYSSSSVIADSSDRWYWRTLPSRTRNR